MNEIDRAVSVFESFADIAPGKCVCGKDLSYVSVVDVGPRWVCFKCYESYMDRLDELRGQVK